MPNRQFNLSVQPPLGGIVRSTGFQQRPPFTAYELLNVWPLDPFTGRAIAASRPPLQVLTSPSGFVTGLQNVNGVVTDQPTQSFVAIIDGDVHWWNGSGFTAVTGATFPTDRPTFMATLHDKVVLPLAENKPVVFDYSDLSLAEVSESAGTAPSDTRIAVQWLGAIWLAGSLSDPHILYASRAGDLTDWDFSAAIDDQYGAFFTTTDNEGFLGGPITALIPQTSDVMLVSTIGGISALRGHPRQGGVFDALSPTYVLGQGAWCKAPDDTVFFLTPKGLMSLPPGAHTIPTQVSKGRIPEELIGLAYDYEDPVVSMVYDSRWNMVLIFVRGAEEQAWAYDLTNGGFFRLEFAGYPYVAMEHEPFISDQSSGVLLGGVNLRFFDKFASEDFETGGTIGPFRLTPHTQQKAKIIRLKATFGGDTPNGTGTLAVACGTDGQDVIARLAAGSQQYEIPLEKLALNDGVCFPQVAGHAAAIQFTSDDGRVALEEIEITATNAGVNRLPRSPQLSPEGEPIDFTAVEDEFDFENWQGYSEATPAVPDCSLTDFNLWVDLSRLPASWWSVVAANGADIRVTNNLNSEVPFDLVNFDHDAETGFLTLKMTQQSPPTPVRIWAGNPFVGAYAADDANGQYNAYDDNWRAFYAEGGGNDRTQYLNHLTHVDSTPGDTSGIIGVASTNYSGASTSSAIATEDIESVEFPATLIGVGRRVTGSFDHDGRTGNMIDLDSGSASSGRGMGVTDRISGSNIHAENQHENNSRQVAQSSAVATTIDQDWHHIAGTCESYTTRSAFIDGGNKATKTGNVGGDHQMVRLSLSHAAFASQYGGHIALAQYHTVVRSDCFIDYQAQMLDQSEFWGTWDDFVEVNDPDDIAPPDEAPPVAVCSGGFVTPTEVGTWSGYAEATPDAPPANMPNWVHFIDLSEMPTAWWAAVATDGSDIRATDSANQFIPIDLIEFDASANTGFACVRLNQAAGSPAAVRLWVGNGSAISLLPCATYGQYRVYDQYWRGFWPSGGGNDRTYNKNHLTAVGSPTVGGVTGPIGTLATNYNGTTQYSHVSLNIPLSSYPATLAAVARTSDFEQTAAIVSAARTKYLSHDSLMVGPDPTPAPTRFSARANEKTHTAVSLTTESANTWTHKAGFAANNVTRNVVAAGGTLAASPKKSLGLRSFGILAIGARRTGSGKVYWPFTGDICLASAHSAVRATDNSWAVYQAAMLDQSDFWNGWSWNAETSDLDQS